MKTSLLNFSFFGLSVLGFLNAQTPSRVTVFSQNGEKFWVIVNGVKQNDQPATHVRVGGLTMPNAMFKIIFEDEKIPSIDKNTLLRDADNKPLEISYVIRRNKKGEMVMSVSSFAPIEEGMAASPPPQDMTVVNYRANERQNNVVQLSSGSVTTTTTTTTTTGMPSQGINMQINDGIGGNVGVNVTMDGLNTSMEIRETQSQTQITTQTTRPTQTTSVVSSTMPSPAGRCVVPVSQSSFENFKNSIRNTSFTDTQEKMARDYLRKNCLSAQQIKELVSLIKFDDTQLNLAKFAYDYCVDKENYFVVADALKFSSSKEELMEYISNR